MKLKSQKTKKVCGRCGKEMQKELGIEKYVGAITCYLGECDRCGETTGISTVRDWIDEDYFD